MTQTRVGRAAAPPADLIGTVARIADDLNTTRAIHAPPSDRTAAAPWDEEERSEIILILSLMD
jgi:hypothetical protein